MPIVATGKKQDSAGPAGPGETRDPPGSGAGAWKRVRVPVLAGLACVFAALVAVRLAGVLIRRRTNAAGETIGRMSMAVVRFREDVGVYPERLDDLVAAPSGSAGWKGPYLEGGLPDDPWGTAYRYGKHRDEYLIVSAGPDRAFDTSDDVKY